MCGQLIGNGPWHVQNKMYMHAELHNTTLNVHWLMWEYITSIELSVWLLVSVFTKEELQGGCIPED